MGRAESHSGAHTYLLTYLPTDLIGLWKEASSAAGQVFVFPAGLEPRVGRGRGEKGVEYIAMQRIYTGNPPCLPVYSSTLLYRQ